MINDRGTILAPTFGGGANSLVTEVLGEAAIISSDFGGNPPYEKMKAVGAICYRHFLKQTNVLFIIGGKSNNTDILETFRHGRRAQEHFGERADAALRRPARRAEPGARHGQPRRDAGEPRAAGFDSAISEVVNYAKKVDAWMRAGGREEIAASLGLKAVAA